MNKTDQATIDRVQAKLNRVFAENPDFADLLPRVREPRWRYYGRRGAMGQRNPGDLYFWTTEAIQHNSHPRYVSGIYRYIKSRQGWKISQRRYHARRIDAKARALALYQASKGLAAIVTKEAP